MTTDRKKLKKRQADRLRKIALDGRRRLADRVWASNQLSEHGIEFEGHIPGYATPKEGLRALLTAEGGCVGPDEACHLLRRPTPVTKRTLSAQIERGNVVAFQAHDGQCHVPVWQFNPGGGILEGLSAVLKALRRTSPGFDQLTPFTYFLQPVPMIGSRTPLAALRNGEIKKVLEAAEQYTR
jgi:hypothetical protein